MALRRRDENSILRSLPLSELKLLAPDLRQIDLPLSKRLFEPYTIPSDVYFPIDSVISFVGDTGEGGSIEVWAAGREGAAGMAAILGAAKPFRGVVQIAGRALALKASAFVRHFQRGAAFHDAMLGYYNYLLVQASYLGICNSIHPVEHRLCRWLLMTHDRAGSGTLKFTQESIAAILGTRRASISVAAAALQSAGLISYTPGALMIRSRRELERAACRCYKIISSHRP